LTIITSGRVVYAVVGVLLLFVFLFVVAVSVTGRRGVGIPIILLHDAEGGIVTIQLKNGDVLRGVLEDTQDNMNTVMKVRCFPVARKKQKLRLVLSKW
jgi:hypothetical protein